MASTTDDIQVDYDTEQDRYAIRAEGFEVIVSRGFRAPFRVSWSGRGPQSPDKALLYALLLERASDLARLRNGERR